MERNISDKRKELISWLNNAYGMEMGLIPVLETHAREARNMPRLQERIQAHVEQTRSHAQRVQQAIEACGGNVSTGKSWLGDTLGRINALTTVMHTDAVVKNTLMDFGAEQFEIGCYRSLIAAAAQELNLPQVVSLCQRNLEDELEMARWLENLIPEVTRMHLGSQGLRAAA